jgi:hypothetical protein
MEALETRADPADLTFERFKAALEGEGSYPKGAIFIDAEASFAGSAVVRNMREGLPVVLIYPDGVEKIIAPVSVSGGNSIVRTARNLRTKLLSLF